MDVHSQFKDIDISHYEFINNNTPNNSPVITRERIFHKSPPILITNVSPILNKRKISLSNFESQRLIHDLSDYEIDVSDDENQTSSQSVDCNIITPVSQEDYQDVVVESPSPNNQEVNNMSLDDSMLSSDESVNNETIDHVTSQDITIVTEEYTPMSFTNKSLIVSKNTNHRLKGLALRLKKIIQLQSARTSFWEHDIKNQIVTNKTVIQVVIKLIWKEFGSTICRCDCSIVDEQDIQLDNENYDSCLLILGNSKSKLINQIEDGVPNLNLYVYPPYSLKTLYYNSNKTLCLHNVTKFIIK